jgi:heme exporter protein B
MTGLGALLRRELSIAWSRGGGPVLALAFFAAVVALLALAVGGPPEKLAQLAGGCAWLALALSSLLSLERLFERDFEDGALDLLALGGPGLELVCFIKCLAQWLATGLPLALAAPAAAIALGASPDLAPMIGATALVGGLGFAFTGGVGAALSLGSKRGGLLIAAIVLPLFVPPVIFGGGAILAYADGMAWGTGFALLSAYSLAAAALSPLAMAAACRNAIG